MELAKYFFNLVFILGIIRKENRPLHETVDLP